MKFHLKFILKKKKKKMGRGLELAEKSAKKFKAPKLQRKGKRQRQPDGGGSSGGRPGILADRRDHSRDQHRGRAGQLAWESVEPRIATAQEPVSAAAQVKKGRCSTAVASGRSRNWNSAEEQESARPTVEVW